MDVKDTIAVKDGVWRMDADAFLPDPEGYITIKGVEYPIYSFLDIPNIDALKIAKLGSEVAAADSFDAMIERSIEQVMLLNAPKDPETGKPLYGGAAIPREAFDGLTPKQVIAMTTMANKIAQVPLKAEAEKSEPSGDSPSPSPASAASTDGAAGASRA